MSTAFMNSKALALGNYSKSGEICGIETVNLLKVENTDD
jgi:hypothetical protein